MLIKDFAQTEMTIAPDNKLFSANAFQDISQMTMAHLSHLKHNFNLAMSDCPPIGWFKGLENYYLGRMLYFSTQNDHPISYQLADLCAEKSVKLVDKQTCAITPKTQLTVNVGLQKQATANGFVYWVSC